MHGGSGEIDVPTNISRCGASTGWHATRTPAEQLSHDSHVCTYGSYRRPLSAAVYAHMQQQYSVVVTTLATPDNNNNSNTVTKQTLSYHTSSGDQERGRQAGYTLLVLNDMRHTERLPFGTHPPFHGRQFVSVGPVVVIVVLLVIVVNLRHLVVEPNDDDKDDKMIIKMMIMAMNDDPLTPKQMNK